MMLDLTNLSLYACKMETGSRTCEHSNNLLIKSVDWGLLKADINLLINGFYTYCIFWDSEL